MAEFSGIARGIRPETEERSNATPCEFRVFGRLAQRRSRYRARDAARAPARRDVIDVATRTKLAS